MTSDYSRFEQLMDTWATMDWDIKGIKDALAQLQQIAEELIAIQRENLNYIVANFDPKCPQVKFGLCGLALGALLGFLLGNKSKAIPLSMRAVKLVNGQLVMKTAKFPASIPPKSVLVRVHAVALDSIDFSSYRDQLRRSLGFRIPQNQIPGKEFSGTLVAVGNRVKCFSPGDKVMGLIPLWEPEGCLAEYVVVREEWVGLKPSAVGFESAATLPYAFCKVWGLGLDKVARALIYINLGNKSDGVGVMAVQLLASYGVRVTVCVGEGEESTQLQTFLASLKTLGAESHLVLPREPGQLRNVVQRLFDVVVNTDCEQMTSILQKFAKDPKDSVIETFPSVPSYNWWAAAKIPMDTTQISVHLDSCRSLVDSRRLVPIVAKSFNKIEAAARPGCQATVGKSVFLF